MTLKKWKQRLFLGIILLSHVQGRELHTEDDNVTAKQNKRNRRETVGNNEKMMLQFDQHDSSAKITIL